MDAYDRAFESGYPYAEVIWDLLLQAKERGEPRTSASRSGWDMALFLEWAEKGEVDRVRFLIELGTDPSLGLRDGEQGRYPLTYACAGGHLSTARLLLEHGADPNQDNYVYEWSHAMPLQAACNSGDLETLKLLVEHGANVQRAPLLFFRRASAEQLEYLRSLGVDLHARDLEGHDAIYYQERDLDLYASRNLVRAERHRRAIAYLERN